MKRSIKIRTAMLIGFGVIIAITLIVSIAAFSIISLLNQNIGEMGNKRLPEAVILGDLTENILTATVYLQKAIISDNRDEMEKSIENMLATRKSINDNFEKLKVLIVSEKGKSLYQAMLDARKPTAATRDQLVKYLKEGKRKEAIEMMAKLEPLQSEYVKSVNNMDDYVKEKAKNSIEKAESLAGTSMVSIVGLAIVALLISLFTSIWIIRIITKPLNDAIHVANQISAGDLTVKIEESGKSETGLLLIAMNSMIIKLKGLIHDVKQASDSVASGSDQLSASSEEIARTMNDQSSRSSQIATSAEEMSQTVIDIAKNASEIAQSSSQTAEIARKGADVVNNSVSESKTIVETVNTSTLVMQSLGEKSKQIGEIVAVINDIADQTNLLALNAAIEAARAGEQGRGFAVVADEVRKLAERTAKATSEIGQMIGSIQGEVDKAVQAMSHTNEKVNVGLKYSMEAGDQLQAIVHSVMSLQSMVQQIASATEEMSTTAEAISGDIQAVAGGAKEISGGSDQIAQSSSELANVAGRLQNVVNQFKV